MNHLVVVEIECSRQYNQLGANVIEQCWNIVFKVPWHRDDLDEQSLELKGCLAWVENNRAEGSKYAIVKMFII